MDGTVGSVWAEELSRVMNKPWEEGGVLSGFVEEQTPVVTRAAVVRAGLATGWAGLAGWARLCVPVFG